MALANVAWALASNGVKVLAIDWDLEAPGLHRYFHPFLSDPELVRTEGLMDRLWAYAHSVAGGDGTERADWSDLSDLATRLEMPNGVSGSLSFIGAGRQDGDYSRKVNRFDWTAFYEVLAGKTFIDALATWARGAFDVVLVDSRTGVSDCAGICTVQLPSTVILTFVYNRQSIEGTAAVARSILSQRDDRGRPVRVIPVPTRVEEKQAAQHARQYAAAELHRVVGKDVETTYRDLRLSEIRHHFWCAYEEKLAVFEEDPEERGTLLADMHALASRLCRPVNPIAFDADELAHFWRRAAFSDPRLADLESLALKPVREGWPTLLAWLEQALRDEGERTDWLAALADRCVAAARDADWPDAADLADRLGAGGLALARRVAGRRANGAYDGEFGRLLLGRVQSLEERGLSKEALRVLEEATGLLGGHGGTVAVQLAQALERRARDSFGSGEDDVADGLMWDAGHAYARAAPGEPRLYAEATRVLLRLTSLRNRRLRQPEARAARDAALSFIAAGRAAGVDVSPLATVTSLLEGARAAMEPGDPSSARQLVQELVDTIPTLGDDEVARRLKAEALEVQAKQLLAEGDLAGARAAVAELASSLPGGLPAVNLDLLSAEIDVQAGDLAKAVAAVGAIVNRLDPDSPRAIWMRVVTILSKAPAPEGAAAVRRPAGARARALRSSRIGKKPGSDGTSGEKA